MPNLTTTLFNFTLYNPYLSTSIFFDYPYYYEDSIGTSFPFLTRYSETTPNQEGVSDCGFSLSSRSLVFKLLLSSTSPSSFYSVRASLIDILRPSYTLKPSVLECKLPDLTIWRLNVFCSSLSFSPYVNVNSSPTLSSPYSEYATFTLSAPEPIWVQVIPPTITTFTISETKNITYTGSWYCYPSPFTIVGPVVDPIITNLSNNAKISLTYSLADTIVMTIDLISSHKTITIPSMGGTQSLLPFLSYDSDLDSFQFLPQPDALGSINSIKFEGTSLGANTLVSIGFTPTMFSI